MFKTTMKPGPVVPVGRQVRAMLLACGLAAALLQGCSKDETSNETSPLSQDATLRRIPALSGYQVTNLVSDTSEYNPAHIDSNLVNAWGMAFGPTGGIWVSAADKGLSTIYSKSGATLRPPVSIPFGTDSNGASPTGQVYNSTPDFVIPSTGEVSHFIFATENGTLAAWASGNSAVTVADRSGDSAVYKGIEMVRSGGSNYLLATDFHNARIDVFDHSFNYVGSTGFTDPNMAAGFAPFNVRMLNGKVFVTYAKQEAPENKDDEPGPGNGYVSIFSPDGTFLSRFASQGTLNSPWGLEILNTGHGDDQGDDDQGEDGDGDHHHHQDSTRALILVGNFGDGHISAFDMNGSFVHYLMSNGQPIEIEGLWALSFPPAANSAYRDTRSRLYFTSGPDGEEHGVFGYITRGDDD